jgi:hypothetical protein
VYCFNQVDYDEEAGTQIYGTEELEAMLLSPGSGDKPTPRHFTRDTWAVQTGYFRAENRSRQAASSSWCIVQRWGGNGHPEEWNCTSCKVTSSAIKCIHLRHIQSFAQPWNGVSLQIPAPEESEDLKRLPGPFRRVLDVYVLDGQVNSRPVPDGHYPVWKSWDPTQPFALTLAVLSDFHGDIRRVTGQLCFIRTGVSILVMYFVLGSCSQAQIGASGEGYVSAA